MIQILSKSIRIFFFGIIPLIILVSGSNDEGEHPIPPQGTCQFKILGKTNLDGSGVASFRSISESKAVGIEENMLELIFEFSSGPTKKVIAFMVPQKLGQPTVAVGKYQIKNVERLFHGVEGIYGFADFGTQSELPYFVNRGTINILKSYDNKLVGRIETEFRNADEEILHVEGFFNAN